MKHTIAFLTTTFFILSSITFAQTSMKEYKAGHVFYVSLPEYMSKTSGLNTSATIQFKNTIKDVAGFIVIDTKEELELADMVFTSIDEFYDHFIKDFIVDQEKRTISQTKSHTIGNVKFIECDASYLDTDSNMEIYYFIGIAETNNAFYKVLCFGSLENKETYKTDFQKILYSIKD